MKCSLGISNFLEEISSLSHSVVFLYFLHWSLRKAFLSLLAILWNSAFRWVYLSFSPLRFTSLLFWAICKASSYNHFSFLHFFFLGMILITASYTMSWISVHSSSGTLSIRLNPLNLFVTSTVYSLGIYFRLYLNGLNFPDGSDSKVSVYNVGDQGSSPGMGRSSGEGNGNPLQYYCLEKWFSLLFSI